METNQKSKNYQTLQLVEFLMKNGSIEFVAVIAEKFKCYIEPYVFYEYSVDYEDHGFASNIYNNKLISSQRMCTQNSRFIKRKRKTQIRKKRSKKIKK